MDKEEFLKNKLKKIAYNYGINIESPVIFKEIMSEFLDIYNYGYDDGYEYGYDDSYWC